MDSLEQLFEPYYFDEEAYHNNKACWCIGLAAIAPWINCLIIAHEIKRVRRVRELERDGAAILVRYPPTASTMTITTEALSCGCHRMTP